MNKNKPFIIAEMSGNHNQSLDRALQIVDAAAEAGVDAVKLQTYTADTMTIDSDRPEFIIDDPKSLWCGRKLYDLYKEAHTPWEWHKPIFERCKERGVMGFSTPFDDTAVEFLESLSVLMYKIASFEIVDIPLIKKVASTGKPMLISTGMATVEEIQEAVDAARSGGCEDITLLKCTSTYPADPKNSNILMIPDMKERFGCRVGISDHTMGVGVSVASVGLGAEVIEKHFTIRRSDGGVDSAFSMEPEEMKHLVRECKNAYLSLGEIKYGPINAEKDSLKFRRSLYAVKDIEKGETFTEENIRSIRPGYGLNPKYYSQIIGKRASKEIRRGCPIAFDRYEQQGGNDSKC